MRLVVVAGWDMDLDHPEEHRERVVRLMKAVYCSLVKGSSTPRSVAASCMRGFIRAVVACGRAATPPRSSKISKRTCTVLYMQTCGAGNGRFVTEDEIFNFSKNDGFRLFLD